MEIKSCPFCGNDAAMLYRNYSHKTRTYFVWMECEVCGAKSKTFASEDDPVDNNWETNGCYRAIAAWNRRAGT